MQCRHQAGLEREAGMLKGSHLLPVVALLVCGEDDRALALHPLQAQRCPAISTLGMGHCRTAVAASRSANDLLCLWPMPGSDSLRGELSPAGTHLATLGEHAADALPHRCMLPLQGQGS
jgi:hypothetical protein